MKKIIMFSYLTIGALISLVLMSADHIDAPSVTNAPSDIADLFAFESPQNAQNLVFIATLQGLLSPANTGSTTFSEDVMVEFNIDNNGDNIEDLVVQAIPRDGKMYVFGPYAPADTGLNSRIDDSRTPAVTDITAYGENAKTGSNAGVSVFAGPRDDPFFFDLGAYQNILGGAASGFSDPGIDAFAGTNVMAITIEMPKSMLGNGGSINTWVETKTRQ